MTFSQTTASAGRPQATGQAVAVFGAYGHTGRFVVSELRKRGLTPILAGRDPDKLAAFAAAHPGLEARPASIDDPASLDRAIAGAAAIINCAGPFLDTATPVVGAALRARVHYFDMAAEQGAAIAAFENFPELAHEAGVVVVPAMAFYGGLGDLLATAAMGDWTEADEILIAVALDSWLPTLGTRLTGQRNTARRLVFSENKLQPLADPPPKRSRDFPPPFGTQDVVGLPLTEIIAISRHLKSPEIHSFMNLAPLTDLRDPNTPAPTPADESGRSAQTFMTDAIVRKGGRERRATAYGRDIYAVTAPLVVEAVVRALGMPGKVSGVVSAGEIFDARDFLGSLEPEHLTLKIS